MISSCICLHACFEPLRKPIKLASLKMTSETLLVGNAVECLHMTISERDGVGLSATLRTHLSLLSSQATLHGTLPSDWRCKSGNEEERLTLDGGVFNGRKMLQPRVVVLSVAKCKNKAQPNAEIYLQIITQRRNNLAPRAGEPVLNS